MSFTIKPTLHYPKKESDRLLGTHLCRACSVGHLQRSSTQRMGLPGWGSASTYWCLFSPRCTWSNVQGQMTLRQHHIDLSLPTPQSHSFLSSLNWMLSNAIQVEGELTSQFIWHGPTVRISNTKTNKTNLWGSKCTKISGRNTGTY